MRHLTFVVLLSLVFTLSCSRKPKGTKDQVSYTIGVQFGNSLRGQKLDLDADILARGIADGLAGDKPRLSEDEMQAAVAHLSEEKQKEAKVEADTNKNKAGDFLSQNKLAEGVQTTKSGLQYKITAAGTGASPKGDDIVVVNYKGTLIDGTEFDSSYKRGLPAEFPLKGVIPGWTEGLMLLKKGGKAVFYVPPELGYADHARPPIPNNAVLIFAVELVDVKSPPKKKAP